MRALRFLLPIVFAGGIAAAESARNLTVPTEGEPSQRVLTLWTDTRAVLMSDAAEPLSDEQAVARGTALIAAWTTLQQHLAGSEADGDANAVLKLLNDFYGRPYSPPARRIAVRNDTRRTFAERLTSVEARLSR